ncbi:MAG TPA: hypothetical protein VFU59_01340 [Candidatus Eisenbacteria bacterium]|nr:hypothetical protein [Candidatus Eisenbacteria bacterium]
MRRSRSLLGPALLIALFLSPLGLVRPDPAAAAPAPIAPADSTLRIYPMTGAWIDVEYVGYWSMDTFRYRTVDGDVGYLAANRIRSIEDGDGEDWLELMMREKSSFGVFRPGSSGPPTPWLKRVFSGPPLRERSAYVTFEWAGSARASGSDVTGRNGSYLSTGIGAIKNLSPRWGVGGVVQFFSDGDDYRAASAGIRVRHYLRGPYTIETTHGLFDASDDGDRRGFPYFGEVAICAADMVSLFTRAERHDYTRTYYRYGFFQDTFEVSEMSLQVGVRLGPKANALSVPGFVLGSLVTLSPGGREIY